MSASPALKAEFFTYADYAKWDTGSERFELIDGTGCVARYFKPRYEVHN